MKYALVGILLLGVLLTGCVSVRIQPILPLPQVPELHFQAQAGLICLPESDANALGKFFDQLNAYQHALDRLGAH